MSNAEENTTGSISDEGVPFSDPISDEAVLLSDEGVPFSDPMSDEAVLLSDEGVPFSDAGSDLEETASIIGSLFWPKASNWPHRGQAGRGSRLKLISSVGCPGEASHSPGQLPRELGLLRGFPEISDSLGSNADQLKSSAAPGQFLREALTLRKRGRRAGVLRLAAKEFGLAGQLRLAGDLDMTPKEFINSFLEIKNSNLKLRRSYWSIPRGWPSTFALVDAIRGELLRTAEGSLQWSNYIRDQAIIILRSQNPISGIHPNGAYISSAAITPAIFDADSKDRHREKLTVQEMPFLYQMVFGMLSSALDVDHGDAEEPPTEAAAPQSGSIEALEEELMEREGFRYTRGKNGSTSRRRRLKPQLFSRIHSNQTSHLWMILKTHTVRILSKRVKKLDHQCLLLDILIQLKKPKIVGARLYVEEHSTTKRKNRENDSYEPPSSTEECSTTKRQKQGTDSHVPVASAEVVYAAQPSTAKMCRWSTQETIDMLNLMKSNPSSFIDKAFWLRTNDSLREAGHQDQTPSALRGKWDQCGATINTLKHLLKEEKTITFDEDAQTVHDPLQKAPKIIKAL
ncbi:hypothetical protein PSTT_00299, partial [Puccinia striiformis]